AFFDFRDVPKKQQQPNKFRLLFQNGNSFDQKLSRILYYVNGNLYLRMPSVVDYFHQLLLFGKKKLHRMTDIAASFALDNSFHRRVQVHYLSVQINDQYPFSHCFNEFVLGYRQHIKQIKLEQADGDKGIGDNKCKRCRIDRAERLKTTQQIKNIDQPGQSGNDDQEEGMLFINGFGPFETGNQQVVAQQ